MKLLSIIITVTNEHKKLELTLDSIAKIKRDKDVSVVIISNENNIKKDLLKRFNFESKTIQLKKQFGILYNEALANSKCEFITFIDAGDMFDTIGLGKVIEYLKNEKPNILRTDLAESYIGLDGKPAIGILNYTFVETPHAHFFKKEYLIEKNIRFNDKLNIYSLENFYRNAVFNDKINGLKITTYLSGFTAIQYDKNHLPINVKNIDEYYLSIIDTFEMLQKNNNDFYKMFLYTVLYSLFMIVESSDFDIPTLQDKKRKYEELIYSIYCDYKNEYNGYDDGFKNGMLNIEFEKQRRTNINHKLVTTFLGLISKMDNIHTERLNNENHFLDIIVPEYNGEEFIFDFLDSLARQKDVNFEEIGVIIVNDASPKKIKAYKFKRYGNLNIKYVINEKNVGQGMTRQHGIDLSNAEYITMFDQDDTFYDKDNYCLSKMITELRRLKPNVIIGNVYEQVRAQNGIDTIVRYDDKNTNVFVHGIYMNRKYLMDNGYRFNPKLRQLEDTYFQRTLTSTTTCLYCDIDIYLWRNNKKSQVRTENDIRFTIRTFDDFCLCSEEVYNFVKDKNKDYAKGFLISSLYGAFVLSNCVYTEPVGEARKKEMQLKAYELIKKYHNIMFSADQKERKELYDGEIDGLSRSMPGIKPLESFDDFMKRMSVEYPNVN